MFADTKFFDLALITHSTLQPDLIVYKSPPFRTLLSWVHPVVRGRPEEELVEQGGEQFAQELRPEFQRNFNLTST